MSHNCRTLLLVGGGHAHIQVIKDLIKPKGDKFRFVLVSEDETATYSGMLPAVVAGLRPMEDADVNLRDLCAWYDWQFIQGRVISVQAKQNKLTVVEKSLQNIILNYDVLSMDIGSTVHPIPGLSPSKIGLPMVIATRPISRLPSAVETFEQLIRNDLPKEPPREVVVLGDGAAGFELACALRARFSKKIRTHINITICGRSTLKLGQQFGSSLGRLAKHNLASRSINYVSTKTRVDYTQGIVYYFEDHSQKPFDLCLLATGAAAHSWLKESSDLELNSEEFILVDKTLRTAAYRNVFAAGDCCSFSDTPGFPPKAGVYAVRMGPILTRNLFTALTNSGEEYRKFIPQKQFLTLLSLGDGTAIGSKYNVSFSGYWVYSFKSYIDSKWQDSFKIKPDGKENGGNQSPAEDDVFDGNPTEGAAALVSASDTASNDEFETQLAVLRRMDMDEEFRSRLVAIVNGP